MSVGVSAEIDPESLLPAIQDAWAGSLLAEFGKKARGRLLEGARLYHIDPGDSFYRAMLPESVAFGLVVSGLLRIVMTHIDGRQVTVRYVGSGTLVGLSAAVLGGPDGGHDRSSEYWKARGGAAYGCEALQESIVLRLRPAGLRSVVRSDTVAACALARHQTRRLAEAHQTLAVDLFLPVRARVARHLLDLAQRRDRDLYVTFSHQNIADAIGSVREVVCRVLKRMEREQLVDRTAGSLVLRDPARLYRISEGREAA